MTFLLKTGVIPSMNRNREAPEEELPAEMTEPYSEAFAIRVFVDVDHASEHLTRRSRTGFIVFLNNAPIYWMSKK